MLLHEPWFQIQAVRPIRIDSMEIEHAAGTLWQELLEIIQSDFSRPDQIMPYGKPLWLPNWGPKIKVKNVAGKTNTIPIVVQFAPAQLMKDAQGRVFFSGLRVNGYLQMTAPLVLAVVLNLGGLPSATVKQILQDNREVLQTEFLSVISHELTHAKDFLVKPKYDHPQDDYAAYVNDPMEVRAFMQQIARQVAQAAAEKGFPKPLTSEVVQKLLTQSHTWLNIQTDLKPENRKKMLQGVLTYLRDLGYGA